MDRELNWYVGRAVAELEYLLTGLRELECEVNCCHFRRALGLMDDAVDCLRVSLAQ